MANEMIERVKLAIRDNIQAALPEGVTVDYHYATCAAIMAMRTPTDDMVSEFYEFAAPLTFPSEIEECWAKAIDAALKD